jgi:hypothetical protein
MLHSLFVVLLLYSHSDFETCVRARLLFNSFDSCWSYSIHHLIHSADDFAFIESAQ